MSDHRCGRKIKEEKLKSSEKVGEGEKKKYAQTLGVKEHVYAIIF